MKTEPILNAFFAAAAVLLTAVFAIPFAALAQEDKPEVFLTMEGTLNGQGKFVFTGDTIRYAPGKHQAPTGVTVDGKPWTDLNQPFKLDLTPDFKDVVIADRGGGNGVMLNRGSERVELTLYDRDVSASHFMVRLVVKNVSSSRTTPARPDPSELPSGPIPNQQLLQMALERRAVLENTIRNLEQVPDFPKESIDVVRGQLKDLDRLIELQKELVQKEAARDTQDGNPAETAREQKAETGDKEKQRGETVDSRAELLTGRFADIDFYGRVLDQNDKPAPHVTVTVLLDTVSPDPATFFSARKDIQVKTDEQGFFEYHGFGEQIFVSVHSQDGYERTVGLNPSQFQYGGTPGAVFTKHVPDKNNPVVFRVRKMEEPVPLISKYYSNDRFPFSRVFLVTGYFDLFEKSAFHEYYDELAQPVREWKENGFRPQFSIRQTLVKNEADEQIKKVEIKFYGGITFLHSPTDIFSNVYRMAPALKCTGRDSFTFWIKRKRNPDGVATDYAFSEDEKDWSNHPVAGEDSKQLDRQNFWVEFPGGYFGRLCFTGMNSFPEKDPAAERARIGIRLELNSIPGNRVFERDGRALWDRKKTSEQKELLQTILAPFNRNASPFFPED